MADPDPEPRSRPGESRVASLAKQSGSRLIRDESSVDAIGGLEASAKQQMAMIVQDQPDDSSYAEILRELAFYRMIQRGLADAGAGRVTNDADLRRRLRDW